MSEKIIKNKLVRDKIPDIIREAGLDCEIETLDHSQLKTALLAKLREEVDELESAHEGGEWLEEVADIYEVLLALLTLKGFTLAQLEEVRRDKFFDRGGFSKGYVLKNVTRLPLEGNE